MPMSCVSVAVLFTDYVNFSLSMIFNGFAGSHIVIVPGGFTIGQLKKRLILFSIQTV